MYIKEYETFTRNLEKSYSLHSLTEQSSNYIAYFLCDSFSSLKRIGITDFINELSNFNKDGIEFELVDLNLDQKTNFIYISETYSDYSKKTIRNPALDRLINMAPPIELCKKNLIQYSIMTKENFIHILLAWDNILHQLPPFALLYQDDENWYNVLPFDTQKAVEQFVADHTKNK